MNNHQDTHQPQIDVTTDVSTLTYEQARDQLAVVVQQLDDARLSLQDSMALWEYGEKLATHCRGYLESAWKKIEAARQQQNQNQS